MPDRHQIVVVSGPSCAGKSPLVDALEREHPALAEGLRSPVLFHSRSPRPGEEDGEDYHFRGRKELEALRGDERYRVFEVRDQLQALDLGELDELLVTGGVLYEGHVEIALAVRERAAERDAVLVDLFLSPLSLAEVRATQAAGTDLGRALTELMRRRLLRRASAKKPLLSLRDLEDVETRAGTALDELRRAHEFGHVLPLHDGEDSDHWELFPHPIGDAGRAVGALAALLRGEDPPELERWPADLLG